MHLLFDGPQNEVLVLENDLDRYRPLGELGSPPRNHLAPTKTDLIHALPTRRVLLSRIQQKYIYKDLHQQMLKTETKILFNPKGRS